MMQLIVAVIPRVNHHAKRQFFRILVDLVPKAIDVFLFLSQFFNCTLLPSKIDHHMLETLQLSNLAFLTEEGSPRLFLHLPLRLPLSA
jgi:hypothetical protein